ncbi:DUF4097 family beta strand repeat-containing protein [Paenibacillus aestuarii]|uniref:DUF4097 family beta strand repeat-containing protein n=1 Tax=Paenibacillus aestuarii TaxID=516965 RepID=A0ABW0K9I6_9BACL|nr:DUF4097 family beta strand repeat-containing protein [Paenibacillus aestuarii]
MINVKKTIAFAGLGLGLITVFASGCGVITQAKEVHKKLTFDGKSIQTLNIKVDRGDIELEHSNDDQITLTLTGRAVKDPESVLNTSLDGSTLNVQVKDEGIIGVNLVNSDYKLKLKVPKKVFEQVQTTNLLGDTTLTDFESKNLDLTAKNGLISIHDYKGETYHIKNTLGKIEMMNVTGRGDIDQSNGTVNIDLAEFKQDLTVNSTLGAVSVRLPSDSIFRLESQTMPNRDEIKLPLVFSQKEGERQTGTSMKADDRSPLLKVKASNGKFVLEGK